MRGILATCALAPYFAAGETARAGAEEALSAEEVVGFLHRALTETANADAPLGREERFARLEPTVAATHDLAYIAELTVRRQWRDLTAEQRTAFVDAFRRLSVMTYAARFSNVRPGALKILGADDAGSGRMQVRAIVERPDADPISLDYLLHENDGRWRIINILADGVSDLALKRAEYQSILATGTIDDLIDALNDQTDDL